MNSREQLLPVWSDQRERRLCLGVQRSSGLLLGERQAVQFVHVHEPAEETLPAPGGDLLGLGFVVGDDHQVDRPRHGAGAGAIGPYGGACKLVQFWP